MITNNTLMHAGGMSNSRGAQEGLVVMLEVLRVQFV